MANLASSNVTVISTWTNGGMNSRRNVVKRVKWTGVTCGGATNLIPASAFGFSKFVAVHGAALLDASTKRVYPLTVSADGSYLYAVDVVNATDASRSAVADITPGSDYVYATVEGLPVRS